MKQAPSAQASFASRPPFAPPSLEALAGALESIKQAHDSPDAILNLLVTLLLQATSCRQAAAFTLQGVQGKHSRIRRIVTSPSPRPDSHFLQRLLSDPAFNSGTTSLVDYKRVCAFQNSEDSQKSAGGRVGHVLCLRFCDASGLVGGSIALFPREPDPDERATAECLSGLGGMLLSLWRERRRTKDKARDGDDFRTRLLDALSLGVDAYWEADENGVVKHVIALNEKAPSTRAVNGLQGKDLPSLFDVPQGAFRNAAALDQTFYDRRCVVREIGQSDVVLDLSGRRSGDANTWHGIARAADTPRESRIADRQVRAVIEKLETARDREEALRRETEIILDGLRILTSTAVGPEVFATLLAHLSPALQFQDAVILQKEWSGGITICASTSTLLNSLNWQDAAEQMFGIPDVATICDPASDLSVGLAHALPDKEWRSALVTRIKTGARPAVLLCLHAAPNFFSKSHLGLGTRLSLVASQAFMNEEERQKVVQASKLASIGEMAAGIVHEINQPLSSMTLAVENLKSMFDRGTVDSAKVQAKLDRLREQIDRITKIVGGMRTLARRSEGLLETFSMKNAIDDAATIVHHRLTQSSIEFTADVPGDDLVLGNPLEFTQVIINLLSNACDAMDSHAAEKRTVENVTREITIAADNSDAAWLSLSVRDTGPGFPESVLERALEPFFTTKGAGKGTGLGLALSQRIIESMGGEIAIGNWAKGAEIRLRLRKMRANDDEHTT